MTKSVNTDSMFYAKDVKICIEGVWSRYTVERESWNSEPQWFEITDGKKIPVSGEDMYIVFTTVMEGINAGKDGYEAWTGDGHESFIIEPFTAV